MQHLGSLTGRGRVLVKGIHVGEIEYDIGVWTDGNWKSAEGIATGNGLNSAFEAGRAELELQQGGKLEFLVTQLDIDGATIVVSGAVPGY